ncbi:MAG: hypothetical protein ACI9VR_000204 [Cognaticolwellia sp.]|jgi:hypothetical protein
MFLTLLFTIACDKDLQDSAPSVAPIEVVDMASYLARCEQVLGPMPQIDCQSGAEIAVTVTDAQGTRAVTHSSELESGARCDKPSVAGCGWGSRLGVVENPGRPGPGELLGLPRQRRGPAQPLD